MASGTGRKSTGKRRDSEEPRKLRTPGERSSGGGRSAGPSGERSSERGRSSRSSDERSSGPGRTTRPSSDRKTGAPDTRRESNKGKRGSSREPEPAFSKFRKDSKSGPKKTSKDFGFEKEYDKKSKFKGLKKGDSGKRKIFTTGYQGDKSGEYIPKKEDGKMRLNKFLSNAGIASRRDADKLIELGLVSVNGKVVTELGLRVDPNVDTVKYDDRNLKPEKLRYVLLNKPKDYITTMDDTEERKTVMWLVKDACKERIYPVGRLDRQTTGLLLFTNDGDLAKRLTNPKNGFPKLYHIETVEKVKGTDIDAIREGIKLEDGFIKADDISFVNDDPHHIGIRVSSGKNRVVRRIFEHFNYTVKKLDRVMFAGLTKKDLARGRHRHLTDQEVNFLKMIR